MSNPYSSPRSRHGPSQLRTVHYPSLTPSGSTNSHPTPRNYRPASYQQHLTPRQSTSSHASSRHSYQQPQYPHSHHSGSSRHPSSQNLPHSYSPYAPKEDREQPLKLWAPPPSLPPNVQLPLSTRCQHRFKMLSSESDDLLWDCDMCGSGPHWFIFECKCVERTEDANGIVGIRRCGLKACRNCAYEA